MTQLESHLSRLKATQERLNPADTKKEISYLKNLRQLIKEIEAVLPFQIEEEESSEPVAPVTIANLTFPLNF